MTEKGINNALMYIKEKHNGEIPYQFGSRETAKLMQEYALYIAEQAVVSTEGKFYKGKIHPLSNYGGEALTQINELLQEIR